MNSKPNVVILITITALALGCEPHAPREAGPLERAASSDQTLTSTLTSAPKPEDPERSTSPKVETVEPSVLGVPTQPEKTESSSDAGNPLYEPTLQSDDGIAIRRLITASNIEDREPVAASPVFADGEDRVYAFLELSNESSEAKTVTVFFMSPSGKVHGGVELAVPANAARWRTWAYTRFADELGLWRVEVRSSAGALLGSLPFEVAEGC